MLKEVLKKTADKMTRIRKDDFEETCPVGIIDISNWEWPQGVGMYGLYKIYKDGGEKGYLDYIINWYDDNIKKGIPERNVNTTAPMLTLTYIYEETGRRDYLELITEWADWVYTKMPRTEEGGIQHKVTGEENKHQLWIDTLFMTVLFLARAGVILGRDEYKEEAKKQFLIHIKYLYDRKSGFWCHGWSFDGRHNFAEAYWARGNCWYTVCACEILEILDIKSGVFYDYVIDTLVSQVEALKKTQDKEGGWHTLLDDDDSYIEISAAAGFGYGILKAVRKGYISEEYKIVGEKALKCVVNNISDDGTVENVSYGTGMGHDLDHYRNIPLCPMTYGQALAILVIMEGINGGM